MSERRPRQRRALEAFLDAHVDRALFPLKAVLPANDLAQIRSILAEQMRTDPVLMILIDAAVSDAEK
jgi:hypothetical protein